MIQITSIIIIILSISLIILRTNRKIMIDRQVSETWEDLIERSKRDEDAEQQRRYNERDRYKK